MGELSQGHECKICKEPFFYDDELVYFLGDEIVTVTEQYPDWDSCMCTTCAEERNLI